MRRIIFGFLFFLSTSASAWAQTTVNVTTTNDELNADANISLREAIQMANDGTGDYIINLQAGATYNLTLQGPLDDTNQTGDLDIFRGGMKLTINGNGGGSGPNAVINPSALDPDPLPNFHNTMTILDQGASGNRLDITLNNLDLTGLDTQNNSGAILFNGSSAGNDVLTLNDCYVHDNTSGTFGGGMDIQGVETVTINTSTFANNHAGSFGGAMEVSGAQVKINNSTFSGNSSGSLGGAMYLSGSFLTARSTTIYNNSANSGGGIAPFAPGSGVDIQNSILSGNTAVFNGPDCWDPIPTPVTVTSNGYNVFGDLGNCALAGPQTGDESGDPMLGALADNGGNTPTHAVLAGSPAMDNGDPTGCQTTNGSIFAFDQRGVGFPRAADGDNNGSVICDSGAFEAAGEIDEEEVEEAIDNLSDVIVNASAGDFKGGNSQNAFMNKLNSVLSQLEEIEGTADPEIREGLINEMKNKLINDILAKSNGCGTAPDNNDWVKDCALQTTIQDMVQDILDLLDSL